MKNNILFAVMCFIGFPAAAQTVYFDQNFNSSALVTAYTGAAANRFNTLGATGGATVDIFNNKLRFNRPAESAPRLGFIKTNNFSSLPAAGAALLKYSLELTVSENLANVESGFMFSVGEMSGTSLTAPGLTNTHSNFYVNPTKNAGEFKIATPTQSSTVFQGSKTVVWYINNSGAPVGYMAPDGILSTLGDDAADIWVVGADGLAELAIDEEPASTATIGLKTIKLSANPNFQAVLEIDNMKLSEQPTSPAKSIVSVDAVAPVSVPLKTSFDRLPFPKLAKVTYDDGATDSIRLRYTEADLYNMYKTGTYKVLGVLVPGRDGINPLKVEVQTTVTIRNEIKLTNTFSPNGDGVNDTWVIPDLTSYRQVSTEVFDRDGKLMFQSNDPKVGWDGKNKNGEVLAGSYFYIIKVRDLSLTKKGVLTVIK